jgi:hypothetical protein
MCWTGYDIIIDQDLKPWLLEVNASPSLTANTREDYLMKTEMLHGMLDIVDMDGMLRGDEEHVSGWDLVYDNGYIGKIHVVFAVYQLVSPILSPPLCQSLPNLNLSHPNLLRSVMNIFLYYSMLFYALYCLSLHI